jgi:hypothetical protein
VSSVQAAAFAAVSDVLSRITSGRLQAGGGLSQVIAILTPGPVDGRALAPATGCGS